MFFSAKNLYSGSSLTSSNSSSEFFWETVSWAVLQAFLVALMVKNQPAMPELVVRFLGWEDPLEQCMQPTPVFFPGESPWTEEPGGLQPMGLHRVRYYQEIKHSTAHERITMLDFLCLAQPSLNKKQSQVPLFPSFHKLHCWGHVSIRSAARRRGTWKQAPRPRGSRLHTDMFSQRYLTLGFPELTVPSR